MTQDSLQRGNQRGTQDEHALSEEMLKNELQRIKAKMPMGSEVELRWVPGIVKDLNSKPLEEEVIGDTIFIYTEKLSRAIDLVAHGFGEWLLNEHSKPYRILANKLIETFEEIQYHRKERIVDAIAKLLQE